MGSFKLGTMTLRSIFKKPETILYPVVEKSAPDGLKGHIENDMAVCILCGICAKTCPAGSLRVDKAEKLWAIDRFGCVQCGSCTRACPKSCLTMEPTYQKPSASKREDVYFKPEESQEEKAAKEAAKAAKIEAAMKAKEAKEAEASEA
ncbi:MAG: 4Fe-4S binding protein [Eggerthellaceae bacterium]|nr:4Fe-4S binding protein [Eggerthellaceae bacterium]